MDRRDSSAQDVAASVDSSIPAKVTQLAPPPPPHEESAPEKPERLTFYDNLPKGNQAPLGSGINLPPVQPKKAVQAKPEIAVNEQLRSLLRQCLRRPLPRPLLRMAPLWCRSLPSVPVKTPEVWLPDSNCINFRLLLRQRTLATKGYGTGS